MSGCSNLTTGAYADSITTYAGIQTGATELNPLLPQSAAGAALMCV